MEDESKIGVKPVVQEFALEKIKDRKLSVDGENYLQWRKIVGYMLKDEVKKSHWVSSEADDK